MPRYKNISVKPELHDRLFDLAAAKKTSTGVYASRILARHADNEEKRLSRRSRNVATSQHHNQ